MYSLFVSDEQLYSYLYFNNNGSLIALNIWAIIILLNSYWL